MTSTYEIVPCPVCHGREQDELADGDELRREVEELWAFHLRRLRAGVPAGNLHDRVVFSQERALRLARCRLCETVFRNPRARGDEVVALYAEEEPDPEVLENLFQTQRRSYRAQARRLGELLGGRGAGLEVGSYVGAFLGAAREEGWDFEGVDVNAAANRFAAAKGFSVRAGTLESLGIDRRIDRRYDAVAIWNCFDQLPDPRAAVRAARALLRPGGSLAIRVPNGGCYAAWRARLRGPAAAVARAVLAHNNLLGFPYQHGFTPGSLSWLLETEGFRVVAVLGDTLVPIADRWTRRWAAVEERLLKSVLRALPGLGAAPWFEVYARLDPARPR